MESRNKEPFFRFSGSFYFLSALAILVLPADWILSCAIAAFFHEGCHLIAIYFCTGKWQQITISADSASIGLPNMSGGKELICTLAGPAGGLILTILFPWLPRLAVCAFVQSLYNLLPIYPLDGGRAVKSILYMLLPSEYAEFVSGFVGAICLGILLSLSIYACLFLGFGPVPIAASLLILFKSRKFPCKAVNLAVQ